jgi:hypothetical protein
MKRYYLFLFLWVSFSTLFAQQTEYENWDGIFMEILPDTNNDNRYTEDNETYKLWNTYKFNYQYITKSGEELYYWNIPSWEWEFVSKENLSDDAIIAFQMRIISGACNGDVQSCIEFLYIMNTGDFAPRRETTGLIENEKNIWLHPPRSSLFKILELNPFPFIQKPYEKGNKWHWSLEIGSQWGDPRWKEWEGIIENQYTYEIVDANSLIHTQLGELKCYKVDSYAESEFGKTYLTAYFNEIYGFVRLEYINIDGSTLNIELYSTVR